MTGMRAAAMLCLIALAGCDSRESPTSAHIQTPDVDRIWVPVDTWVSAPTTDDATGIAATLTDAPTFTLSVPEEPSFGFWIRREGKDDVMLEADARCVSICNASKQGCVEVCDEQ